VRSLLLRDFIAFAVLFQVSLALSPRPHPPQVPTMCSPRAFWSLRALLSLRPARGHPLTSSAGRLDRSAALTRAPSLPIRLASSVVLTPSCVFVDLPIPPARVPGPRRRACLRGRAPASLDSRDSGRRGRTSAVGRHRRSIIEPYLRRPARVWLGRAWVTVRRPVSTPRSAPPAGSHASGCRPLRLRSLRHAQKKLE